MCCLKHLPKDARKKHGSGYAEHHYKIKMTRIYERSKSGKRGFVPFGFYCPKCDKVYSDLYLENFIDKNNSVFHRYFTRRAS